MNDKIKWYVIAFLGDLYLLFIISRFLSKVIIQSIYMKKFDRRKHSVGLNETSYLLSSKKKKENMHYFTLIMI